MAELETLEPEQLADLGEGLLDSLDDKGKALAPVTAAELVAVKANPEAPEIEGIIDRLAQWIDASRDKLFGDRELLPPFDHLRDFWTNFDAGPRDGAYYRASPLKVLPTRLLDLELRFPFGVPACALTPKSEFIGYFAALGYDLLTYKTVRDQSWPAYEFPQWGFLDPSTAFSPADVDPAGEIDRIVIATLNPAAALNGSPSLANSFGVPSLPAEKWAIDVRASKNSLGPGQALIVSVMGTPEVLHPNEDAQLVEQFADTAELAAEAGADIVEVNLSCPNTGGELLCRDPELSRRVVKAAQARLSSRRIPLFVKISYLDPARLEALILSCQPFVQGVVAINSVQAPTHDDRGHPFFQDRRDALGEPTDHAGISGSAILQLGLETTQQLAEIRANHRAESDWVIVSVGGVTEAADFKAYRDRGADAVQSCSGAWLNPALAADIREQFGHRSRRDRLVGALENLSTGGAVALRQRDPIIRRVDAA